MYGFIQIKYGIYLFLKLAVDISYTDLFNHIEV